MKGRCRTLVLPSGNLPSSTSWDFPFADLTGILPGIAFGIRTAPVMRKCRGVLVTLSSELVFQKKTPQERGFLYLGP